MSKTSVLRTAMVLNNFGCRFFNVEIPPGTVEAFRWNYDRKRITAAFCRNLKNKELLLWFTVILPCTDNFPIFQLPLFLKMHVCRVAFRFLPRLLRGPLMTRRDINSAKRP